MKRAIIIALLLVLAVGFAAPHFEIDLLAAEDRAGAGARLGTARRGRAGPLQSVHGAWIHGRRRHHPRRSARGDRTVRLRGHAGRAGAICWACSGTGWSFRACGWTKRASIW